jgi:putative toxin-antitoxin system antitoxin component (TIGR02293 family)
VLTEEQRGEIYQEVSRILQQKVSESAPLFFGSGQSNLLTQMMLERTLLPVSVRPASADHAESIASQSLEPLVRVIARAVEVLGTSEKALRWVNTPVRSLDDQTPVSLSSPEGITRVEDALGRIEHGVW